MKTAFPVFKFTKIANDVLRVREAFLTYSYFMIINATSNSGNH